MLACPQKNALNGTCGLYPPVKARKVTIWPLQYWYDVRPNKQNDEQRKTQAGLLWLLGCQHYGCHWCANT